MILVKSLKVLLILANRRYKFWIFSIIPATTLLIWHVYPALHDFTYYVINAFVNFEYLFSLNNPLRHFCQTKCVCFEGMCLLDYFCCSASDILTSCCPVVRWHANRRPTKAGLARHWHTLGARNARQCVSFASNLVTPWSYGVTSTQFSMICHDWCVTKKLVGT